MSISSPLVLSRFEVNVGGSILERFPDDLVDELDDAGFLVAFGDFLVFADEQLERFVILGEFVEGLGADAIVFLEGLVDLGLGGEGELDRGVRVELHRVEHRRVERIADGDLERAVLEIGGQGKILEGDLGGNLVPGFGGHVEFLQVDERPPEDHRQLLQESFLGDAGLAADELDQ